MTYHSNYIPRGTSLFLIFVCLLLTSKRRVALVYKAKSHNIHLNKETAPEFEVYIDILNLNYEVLDQNTDLILLKS